jgi:hypothetical protein
MVQKCLDEEQERCLDYLIEETRKPLLRKVLSQMIEDPALEIIMKPGSGLGTMIRLKQYQAINLMYKIFDQVPPAKAQFEKFLVETVVEDCKNITHDSELINNPKAFIEK